MLGNKKVNAQRVVPPSGHSCWRLSIFRIQLEAIRRLALESRRALTNYFPPLTHDPVGENKKVNAQRFERPSVHSGERRTNSTIRGEIGFGLALVQAAR